LNAIWQRRTCPHDLSRANMVNASGEKAIFRGANLAGLRCGIERRFIKEAKDIKTFAEIAGAGEAGHHQKLIRPPCK